MKPPIKYKDSLWKASEFVARPIPEREWLIAPIFQHPGLGMIYSWRGSVKTFTAMSLAIAVARGEKWMGYSVPKARGSLYLDGEMPLADLRSRLDGMTRDGVPDNLYILASEDLAVTHRNINLAERSDRDELTKMFAELPNIEFIVLDNWTSMVRGVDENDNSQMDPVKEWLITLRHGERSVLIIHHAGKAGGQRGGSAREDVIDWSAKLERRDTAGGKESYFNFTFDKMRTGMPEDPQFVMRLNREEDGRYVLVRTVEAPKAAKKQWDDDIIALLKSNGPMKFKAIVAALDPDESKAISKAVERMTKLSRLAYYPTGEYGAVE